MKHRIEELKELVKQREWPGVDSITMGDGVITLLNISFPTKNNYLIEPYIDADIFSYLKYNADGLIPFDVFSKFRYKNYMVFAGDASLEGNGIIYLMDHKRDELIWFAFFECSEYFKSVTINEKEEVCAVSAANIVWKIPIMSPLNIELIHPKEDS